jgi:uncharacterized oxidoreductase
MPLQAYVDESMQILTTQPDASEIIVDRVKFLRFASEGGQFENVFNTLNQRAR